MTQSEQVLQAEVNSLAKQIDHVKAVVSWQQDYARSSGFCEDFKPVELMEDAFRINQEEYARSGISVVREYGALPLMNGDRHKILQILINLMKNARQALPSSGNGIKRVVLGIRADGQDHVRFEVSDSGGGIPAENLERIFSLGFTTKPKGHGFGLHSGANSAKEMGGRLFATSEGAGLGSTFVLELPISLNSKQTAPVNTDPVMKQG
jgi:signal transduction histidine kinase